MYADRQLFKRFCFCLPLRYGLLLLGIGKLVALLYTIYGSPLVSRRLLYIFDFTAIIIAIIFAIILIVAAVSKNTTLFKAYFIYAILEAIIVVSVTTVLILQRLGYILPERVRFTNFGREIGRPLGYIATIILVNFYTVLLVRSELMILNSKNLNIPLVKKTKESPCDINVCETI
ncbi:hypothetical protein evm_012516 [Chilo suppressalis]|nr:hypothetical protein evm_012516 [Chilo suppressalis]